MTCPGLIVAVGSTLCCLLSSPVRLTAEAAQLTDRPSSGTIRSTITLAGHSLTVDFTPRPVPTFTAERSAGLIPAPPSREAIGYIESTAPVNFAHASGVWPSFLQRRSRLWLSRSGPRARLEIETTTGTSIDTVIVDLLQTHKPAWELLNVSLTPIGDRSASFVLAWGTNRWTTTLTLPQSSPLLRRGAQDGGLGDLEQYVRALARTRTLGERNEASLALSRTASLDVLFWRGIDASGRDFGQLASLKPGAVVAFSSSAVTRLRTTVALEFGSVHLPGPDRSATSRAYGLWLKFDGVGWRLIFTSEPDVWGSQYESQFDIADVPVSHTDGHDPARPFAAYFSAASTNRAALVIVWGQHNWEARFRTAEDHLN